MSLWYCLCVWNNFWDCGWNPRMCSSEQYFPVLRMTGVCKYDIRLHKNTKTLVTIRSHVKINQSSSTLERLLQIYIRAETRTASKRGSYDTTPLSLLWDTKRGYVGNERDAAASEWSGQCWQTVAVTFADCSTLKLQNIRSFTSFKARRRHDPAYFRGEELPQWFRAVVSETQNGDWWPQEGTCKRGGSSEVAPFCVSILDS